MTRAWYGPTCRAIRLWIYFDYCARRRALPRLRLPVCLRPQLTPSPSVQCRLDRLLERLGIRCQLRRTPLSTASPPVFSPAFHSLRCFNRLSPFSFLLQPLYSLLLIHIRRLRLRRKGYVASLHLPPSPPQPRPQYTTHITSPSRLSPLVDFNLSPLPIMIVINHCNITYFAQFMMSRSLH